MEIKNELLRYIELQDEIKRLTEEKKKLNEFLCAQMGLLGADQIKMPQGTFFTRGRTEWQYSDALEDDIESIKLAKADEIKKGIATVKSITMGIAFTPAKVPKDKKDDEFSE